MTHKQAARDFFEACETGKGWTICKEWCHDSATFTCQADVLMSTKTLKAYTEWMQWLLVAVPDGHYELNAFAVDPDRGTVVASAIFRGTQSGEGGPVPPTGNSVASDYAYVLTFEGEKIRHMTKIWNDAQAVRALGWT